jgi:hypothetical protein
VLRTFQARETDLARFRVAAYSCPYLLRTSRQPSPIRKL